MINPILMIFFVCLFSMIAKYDPILMIFFGCSLLTLLPYSLPLLIGPYRLGVKSYKTNPQLYISCQKGFIKICCLSVLLNLVTYCLSKIQTLDESIKIFNTLHSLMLNLVDYLNITSVLLLLVSLPFVLFLTILRVFVKIQ